MEALESGDNTKMFAEDMIYLKWAFLSVMFVSWWSAFLSIGFYRPGWFGTAWCFSSWLVTIDLGVSANLFPRDGAELLAVLKKRTEDACTIIKQLPRVRYMLYAAVCLSIYNTAMSCLTYNTDSWFETSGAVSSFLTLLGVCAVCVYFPRDIVVLTDDLKSRVNN